MAQEIKDNRLILSDTEAQTKLLEGAKAIYRSVVSTYGPRGRNVLIEKTYGRPMLSRDGVTVARDTYFKDRAKNMGAQLLLEASETTNRIAGDGTTASIALGYHLYNNGLQAIAAGQHPMEVKDQLTADGVLLLSELDKIGTPTKPEQLKQVATVSSGDPLLGELIADAISHVGPDGGILTEKGYGSDVEVEMVDGYYLQNGFDALQAGKKELHKPIVLVCIKRLTSTADMAEVLTKAAKARGVKPEDMQQGQIPRFFIIGNIEEQAYNTVVENINRNALDAIIIKTPPQFGNMSKHLLEDIAILAGCEPITDTTNMQGQYFDKFVGTFDRVVASKQEATIFTDNTTELVEDRVAEIKSQLEAEISDNVAEKMRDRIAKLQGKVAIFRIGGATDTAKEEKNFRVEDAILATRAAAAHGVVPGGGTTLLNLSGRPKLSSIYRKSLQSVFQQLLLNAGLPAEVMLEKAISAPKGEGFNLRAKETELVDMVAVGILDPKLVVEQIIKNATEVAANMLTIDCVLIFEDRKEGQV